MEFSGRTRIYTDETKINELNIRKIVENAMSIHDKNVIEIEELYRIEKNQQVLVREKEVRPEINIVATDPIPSQIVDFKQGYEHGKPIFYIQRANVDSGNANNNDAEVKKDDLRIATLNEMMRECKKASLDSKMARDIKICGLGYRYVTPNQGYLSPFKIYTLNPARTFVIYSNDAFCEPVVAVTYTVNKETQVKKFGCWTKEAYYEFNTADSKGGIKKSANIIGKIPIIEYINNYDIMGSFEKELPLIEAYNVITSDRVNDVCQQVQSILWLHNTKLDKEEKEKLAEGGVIQTQANADGKDAKIEYVNAPLKQADIQTLSTDIKTRILESAGVPKLSEGSNSTGEAMRVTNGWHTAETQAKTSELTWRESEDRMLEVCLAIINYSNTKINDISTLKLSDIDYDMHRSENYDIVSRVNAFVTLTDRGFDISKSALYCKITDDPLQYALDSAEMVDKLRFARIDRNTSLDSENALNEANTSENKTSESIQPSTVKF